MAQQHTWNFYLTAGRTWGGPRISGASITAYSSKTGSGVLQTLTTNINGYATYTLSGSNISPTSYFWRVNIGNVFGDYYQGKNIIGTGDTGHAHGLASQQSLPVSSGCRFSTRCQRFPHPHDCCRR